MNVDERDAVAAQFAVTAEQVERDHLISHLLGFLSGQFADRLHFIGGTALARTHLPHGRISEDIDLIALDGRASLAAELDATLPRAVQRTHGHLEWSPALSAASDTGAATLRADSGPTVRIQLLSSRDRQLWPVERRPLIQRYSDAPAAELLVPTRVAFVASKTAAWHDRRASRDLWDLWALTKLGAIDRDAAELFCRYGPNRPPGAYLFQAAPNETDWQSQLAGQTRLTITAAVALHEVRSAWARVTTSAETLDDK